MSGPSDSNPERDALRDQIIGLGAQSLRKSYYPQLQEQIDELKKAKSSLEEKSESLLQTLKDLETARERVAENERKFRTLFEEITDGIAVVQPGTLRLLMVNRAFCEMLGYTESELLSRAITAIHPPETMPYIIAGLDQLDKDGEWQTLKDLPFTRKDGSIVFTDTNASIIDIEGQHCFLGVCHDITERKQSEEQLRERDEWMRYIIQHDPNAIAVLDRDLKYIFVSDRFLHDYTLQESDIIGKSHYDIIPEMPEKWKEVHRRCLAGAVEREEEECFKHPDGSISYVRWECRPWYCGSGEVGGIILYTELITDRILAEQKLQRSEADLGRAQAIAHLGNWSYDIGTDHLTWSDELYRIFGTTPGQFAATQESFFPLVHPDDRWKHQQALSEALAGERIQRYEIRILRPGGIERVLDVHGFQTETDAEGKPIRVFGVAQDITERRAAEDALRRQQEFNRALVESMGDAVVACNAEGELMLFNRAAREMHGIDVLKIPPEQWSAHYHLFRADGVTPMQTDEIPLFRSFRGEVIHNEPMVVHPVGQQPHYILANSSPFYDANGRNLGAVAVMRDITDHKKAEEALRKAEEHFHRFVEGIPVGYMRWTADGSIVDANNQFLQMLGYSRKDVRTGRLNWIAITPEPFRLADQQAVRSLQTTGRCYPYEKAFFGKNGELVPVLFSSVIVDETKQEGGAFVLDLTERKRAEEELRRLNRLYAVLSQVNQTVVHAGSHEELLQKVCKLSVEYGEFKMVWVGKVNPETHQVIPVASAGDVGNFLDRVRVYADDRPEGRGSVGISIREERIFVSNDFLGFPGSAPWRDEGAIFGFRAIISLPLRNKGKIYGALVVYAGELNFFQDKEVKLLEEVASGVSFALDHLDQEMRRQQDEAALKQAKDDAEAANRAKDQFIAVLSHELRTPLTPVLSTVSFLQLREEISDELRADLDSIRRNVELEAKLIDDLLDVTRISRGILELNRETVDVHALLMKTLEICRDDIGRKAMEISLWLEATDYYVWADSARLQQVLWNLLKNALKFTPVGGRITIQTVNIDHRIRIEVSDNGIGIAPEVLPRIFNAFEQGEKTWTRRFGGLGLGLSISKAIIDLHAGKITAASGGQNQGSIFTVELETGALTPAETVSPPLPAHPADGEHKILLVEDHLDTLRILSRLLQKWGYQVHIATTVTKALELAASEQFDILVSDIGLPDGSGLDIMRRIKEQYEIRGIALSGFGTDEDRLQSRAAGFDLHLTKPVGIENLRASVAQLIQRRTISEG